MLLNAKLVLFSTFFLSPQLKQKQHRIERRMENLKGRTASGRPVARSHYYDTEMSPPKTTTSASLAAAAVAAAVVGSRNQNRPKHAKRKTSHGADTIHFKKARLFLASV